MFIHSFVRSFILIIYMTPLQENYSDELPTPKTWIEDPWKEGTVQMEAISGRGANHQESMVLPTGGTDKRCKDLNLLTS